MLPEYLKKNIGDWSELHKMKRKLRGHALHTVCESARCPNICECFSRGVATFMILGDKCTRSCSFCSVIKNETCDKVDWDEPKRVAQMTKSLKLKHVVITSVTRDDLPDGGAQIFAQTIKEIRKLTPKTKIEILTPDFWGNSHSVKIVVEAKPDIFGHNLETVPRLYSDIRSKADYKRSLAVLLYIKELDPTIITKSGIMVGLGETTEEVLSLFDDLRKIDCDSVCVGHYLQPSKQNIAVQQYIDPKMFELYEKKGLEKGFKYVISGPFVRSSYMADKVFDGKKN